MTVLLTGILFLQEMNIEREKDKEFDKELFAVYVQGVDGNYDQSDSKTFPTDGYELNLEKSSCTNGGVLSQNVETKMINATISNDDKCTLYFDIENKSLTTLKHRWKLEWHSKSKAYMSTEERCIYSE